MLISKSALCSGEDWGAAKVLETISKAQLSSLPLQQTTNYHY
jgi:hypothetical protein